MNNLMSFINSAKGNKYNYLLFFGAKLNKAKTHLIIFLKSNNIQVSQQDQDELTQLIKQFLKVQIKILLDIEVLDYSVINLSNLLNNYFFDNPQILCLLNKDALQVVIGEDNSLKVFVVCDKQLIVTFKDKITQEIEKIFSKFCFKQIDIIFKEMELLNTDILEIRKKKIEYTIKSSQMDTNIKLKGLNFVFGNPDYIPSNCEPIFKLLEGPKQVVAGIIDDVIERSYIKKNKDEVEEEKKYVSFKVVQEDYSISGIYFGKESEKLLEIKNGTSVILTGDIQNRNDILSFKLNSVFYGEIIYPDLSLKANDEYLTIFPEKYQQIEQVNFFEANDEIKSDYLLNNDIVVFDLETTGIDYKTNKIIEFGAVKIKKGIICETFSTLVNPQINIPFDATEVNGITNEMVKNAPKLEDVMPDFYKFCDNCTIVAYNIPFDYSFINYYGKQLGYKFSNPQQDALAIARRKIKGLKSYKLKNVCEALNVSLIDAHRAINDTIATAKVYIKLMEMN